MTDDDPLREPEIPRDRWGRPLVIPPGGGKPIPYTRCTTYIKAIEDTYNLERRGHRMVALGLADRPDLLLSVAAHRDDKDKLNEICEQAKEAAKANAAANTGKALHKLCERYDLGETLGRIPAGHQADIDAYIQTTERFELVAIEQFMVQDTLKVGGTPDRVVTPKKRKAKMLIADIKTGDIEWGSGTIAMQLAMYARSKMYDRRTGQRTEWDINLKEAVVIHLPAGQGTCDIHRVNIETGWSHVLLARAVRQARNEGKKLITPWTDEAEPAADPIVVAINMAVSVDELTKIWLGNQAQWTPQHTEAAATRKTHLLTQERQAS